MAKIIGYTDVTGTELAVLDAVTPGTIAASKAIVVDANKDAADARNFSATNLKAGKAGAAGTVEVFPATTARGKLIIDVTNQTGDTSVTNRIAAMGQATVLTVPDPGGTTANYLLSEGTQTVNGAKSFSNVASQLTAANVGTVTTGATTVAEEHGDGFEHTTKLTLTAFAIGTSADDADLAIGASLYTFPAGTIVVEEASLKGILSVAGGATIADGEIGIGTVIGSTAVDTLGEVGATSENVIEGDVGVLSTYVAGTGVIQISDRCGLTAQTLTILSAGVHIIYLNVAATWPDIAAPAAVTFTGVVTLKWRIVS